MHSVRNFSNNYANPIKLYIIMRLLSEEKQRHSFLAIKRCTICSGDVFIVNARYHVDVVDVDIPNIHISMLGN